MTANKAGFSDFKPNYFKWLEEKQSKAIQMMEAVSGIQIIKEFEKNEKQWEQWIVESEPQNVDMPGVMGEASWFHRCMLMKALRPEKLMFMMRFFIKDQIGEHYASPPPVKLSEIFPDTDAKAPIIFILSKGADPGDTIKELAKQKGKDMGIKELSLGSGAEEKAKLAIQRGSQEGNWVILCNCHLFEDWLPQLLVECDNLREPNSKVHDEFRLFLTARPCKAFPIPILQSGTKIA